MSEFCQSGKIFQNFGVLPDLFQTSAHDRCSTHLATVLLFIYCYWEGGMPMHPGDE